MLISISTSLILILLMYFSCPYIAKLWDKLYCAIYVDDKLNAFNGNTEEYKEERLDQFKLSESKSTTIAVAIGVSLLPMIYALINYTSQGQITAAYLSSASALSASLVYVLFYIINQKYIGGSISFQITYGSLAFLGLATAFGL